MTSEYAFGAAEHGVTKMPAADPAVHQAAQELLANPTEYFERHGEAARQEALAALERRQAMLDEQRLDQARQQRRDRLRRLVGPLLRWLKKE